MRRWITWLRPPWGATARQRERVEAAREWQEDERRHAVERRIEGVAEILNERPGMPEPWWTNQW